MPTLTQQATQRFLRTTDENKQKALSRRVDGDDHRTGANRLCTGHRSRARQGLNLVPAQPSGAPHYWCTWATQNYMYGHGLNELDATILQGDAGGDLARNAMTEENVFARAGWAETFYPKIRSDLFFLLDDGWQTGGTATFELDAAKFPSFTGTAPERLSKLNSAVQKAGWRGAALWCRNAPGEREYVV